MYRNAYLNPAIHRVPHSAWRYVVFIPSSLAPSYGYIGSCYTGGYNSQSATALFGVLLSFLAQDIGSYHARCDFEPTAYSILQYFLELPCIVLWLNIVPLQGGYLIYLWGIISCILQPAWVSVNLSPCCN